MVRDGAGWVLVGWGEASHSLAGTGGSIIHLGFVLFDRLQTLSCE